MAAYKVGAEGGNAVCQYQVGYMYYEGRGVDVDYAQALAWIEKAAAQDDPNAVGQLGMMYVAGKGVTPSLCRSREYFERAIELGHPEAVESMQTLKQSIQAVTSRRSNHSALSSPLVRDLTLLLRHSLLLSHSQCAPLMDKRVEIHGTSRADMNGKRGVATDFHPMGGQNGDHTTWRYTVKLDGGEGFKVKPASVRAEGAGGGSGGGGGGGGKARRARAHPTGHAKGRGEE